MEASSCKICNTNPIKNQKRQMCSTCFNAYYYNTHRRSTRITKKSQAIIGKVYGFWKIAESPNPSDRVLCLCTGCNQTEKRVLYTDLWNNKTKHCGCQFKKLSQWEYKKLRLQNSIQSRLANNLRVRLRTALKRKDQNKMGSHIEELGCSTIQLIEHLESQFESEMSWENYGIGYGSWNIDHIIPLASFDLTNLDDLKKACHYTNLQPLWAIENSSKGARIDD